MQTIPDQDTTIQFAKNPEPRVPCIVLVDVSGSMAGDPITQLSKGLQELQNQLLGDSLACARVEIALVSFSDNPRVEFDFSTVDKIAMPHLQAGGLTRMGEAILFSLDLLKARLKTYRENGISYFRPWMLLLTDGAPTDSIEEASRRIKLAEAQKKLSFFPIGVQGADLATLARLSVREPKLLDGLRFADCFQWLSACLSSVAASQPSQQVPLAQTSWATV